VSNPKMRKKERKKDGHELLIIDDLYTFCASLGLWYYLRLGATTPFRETLNGGDNGGDDATRVLCMCLKSRYVRRYNNENNGKSWDRWGAWELAATEGVGEHEVLGWVCAVWTEGDV
jgi:hypothetical protein